MKNEKTMKVVILPTEKSRLYIYPPDNKLYLNHCKEDVDINRVGGEIGKPQHLYIISDDEIKVGDWFLHSSHGITNIFLCENIVGKSIVIQKGNSSCWVDYSKKIIATTDKGLVWENSFIDGKQINKIVLSQIPESFILAYIKAYNEGKPITEVDLEMINNQETINFHKDLWKDNWVIKTRPDNTVIIHRSKLYTKDEVEKLLEEMRIEFIGNPIWMGKNSMKWIQDNILKNH